VGRTHSSGRDTSSGSYTYEGGAVNFQVRGDDTDGYYVQSATFVVD
jgi:hypothetical protein